MNKYFILALITFLLASCGFKSQKADLIIHNAKIYSVDENFSVHKAMAIAGDSILEIGAEREILNKYSGKQLDLMGAVVYPGFIDAHSHLLGYGLFESALKLKDLKSEDELVEKLKAFVAANDREFYTGRGWDQSEWPDKKWPSRKNIDAISPNKPVLLMRVDGHSALANAKALEIAGINKDTKIEGGYIDFENGILKENAIDYVVNKMPEPSSEDNKNGIKLGADNCFKVGLTTVCDAGLNPKQLSSYKELNASNKLGIRVYAMADPSPENLEAYRNNGLINDDFFKLYSLKVYGDGSLGSRSAALLNDYHDDEGNNGILTTSPDSLKELASICADLGIQMNTHCIGDRALQETFKAYISALQPNNDNRWRIEHVQVVDSADLATFREYGIVPSVQPTHATSDSKWAANRLGEDRLGLSYAYKTLSEQLGWIALGTDFPVEDIDPLATFYSAVFREDIGGKMKKPFLPEQALSKEQALKGITIWAALSMKMEKEVGSLEKGKKADFVVLNIDLLKAEKEDIKNAQVLKTFIGGEMVHPAN